MNSLKILIILHLIFFSISFPSFPSLNFTWEFNLNFNNFLSRLKSSTPDFIFDIQKNMEELLKKTEKEKDKYIKTLTSTVQETYDKIKIKVQKRSKNFQSEIKNLIEKTTETAKALSYKVCDVLNEGDDQCIMNKKKIFSNLLNIVKDNFGKCSIIVDEISNLSENMEFNFKYFLFLAISLTENPDAIEKGMSQIIYDIIYCLQEKFSYLWPYINANLTAKVIPLNVKQDIINLLAQSISNFVTFVQFEEKYGFIEKAENLTGLIKNENAKKVYKNIFQIAKKFNEFGTQSYNISTNLILNVFTNDTKIVPNEAKNLEYKDKGIRITLHLDYMIKNLKAYSVQAVVFESPLVSLRVKRKVKGGTANTFVGITLYDKEGNEIYVKDIKWGHLRPVIYFKKKLFKAMKTCLYYNEEKDKMDTEGVDTEFSEFDGEEYIKCIPRHLSSFTIGGYYNDEEEDLVEENNGEKNEEKIGEEKESKKGVKYGVIKIGMVIIIFYIVFILFRLYKRKQAENTNRLYSESQTN